MFESVLPILLALLFCLHCVLCDDSTLHYEQSRNQARRVEAITSQFISYDVTVIEIYNTLTGLRLNGNLANTVDQQHESSITVHMTAFNQSFQLLLQRNRFMFSSSYVEKSISNSGEFLSNSTTENCYYTGHDNTDERGSTVAVSTCHGLEGYIATQNEVYHVHSVSGDVTGMHFIFRESDSISPSMKCGNENTDMMRIHNNIAKKKRRSLIWPQDLDGTTRVVELYVVNDYSQFLSQGADVNAVLTRTKNIINTVNSLYQSQNIYFVLVGIEIWTSKNRIFVERANATATLRRFLEYRQNFINPTHSNDNAQLITNTLFDDAVVGRASVGSMCTYMSSGAVNSDQASLASQVGAWMAHQIGHNFGLNHDDGVAGCQCSAQQGQCIMHSSMEHASGLPAANTWSTCSVSSFNYALSHGLDYCLNNMPTVVLDSPYCGDGIVGDDEECDCGTGLLPKAECNAACCNVTTCRLVGSAQCSSGRCCDVDNCKFRKQAFECRSAAGDCDLSEYCNGTSAWCPTNVFKRDATNCAINGVPAFCYQGLCKSLQSQCQLIWGSNSQVSVQQCFDNFNIRAASSHGHCGFDWTTQTFSQCAPSDVMCGQLHCASTTQLASFSSSQLFDYVTSHVMINTTQYSCDSVIIDVGMQQLDPGLVPNGVKCGEGQMCFNQQCVAASNISFPSCEANCYSNGICNNLGQCHCNKGFSPYSACKESGCGGSIHSQSPTYGCVEQAGNSDRTGLIVGLCFLFLLILPLLVLASFCGYRHRVQLLSYYNAHIATRIGNTRSQRTTEDNNTQVVPERHTARPPRPRPPAATVEMAQTKPQRPPPPTLASSSITDTDHVSQHATQYAPTRPAPVAKATRPARPAPTRPAPVTKAPRPTTAPTPAPRSHVTISDKTTTEEDVSLA